MHSLPTCRELEKRMSNKLHWHPIVASGPLILAFAKGPAAMGCEFGPLVVIGRRDADKHSMQPRTIAAQALGAIEPETRGVALPVHVSTTFIRDPDNQYRTGYIYGRPDNATVRQTEAGDCSARRRGRRHAPRLRHVGSNKRGAGAAVRRAHCRAEGDVLVAAQLADDRRAALSATRSISSTWRTSAAVRAAMRPRDEAGLDRDAREPALGHHRHRRRRRDRSPGRRHPRRSTRRWRRRCSASRSSSAPTS